MVSLASLGIVAIRTTSQRHPASDVAAWQPRGLELRDGRTLPTYDWRPAPRAAGAPPAAAAREPAGVGR